MRALVARNPAAYVSLNDPFDVRNLLVALRDVGEDDQAEILGERAVALVDLKDAGIVAGWLSALLQAGEDEQASALVAQDPAGQASLGNLLFVVALLDVLHEAGADGQERSWSNVPPQMGPWKTLATWRSYSTRCCRTG